MPIPNKTVKEVLAELEVLDLTQVQRGAVPFTGCGDVWNSRMFHNDILCHNTFCALTWTATVCPALHNCTQLLVGHRGSVAAVKCICPAVRYVRGSHAKLYFVRDRGMSDARVFVGSYNLTNPTISDLVVEVDDKVTKSKLTRWYQSLWNSAK